ncbi:hypothetical protein CR970_04140 [Candidatus Saccharibacteria bacterium]|nr:MAG: hypothetical protein CR970_04140 [Candidatus Saccharibacteria bacterium]
MAINEIQPYVTDVSGAPIDAWVELVGVGEPGGSCVLLTSVGAAYDLPAEILPQDGALALIAGEETETGTLPLHLGELRGAVWLADGWSFGQEGVLYSPVDAADYTALVRDQSMALVDGIWRRTFSPTPGAPNEYLAQAPSPEEVSTACETVHITELLPNPAGEDTDKEWVEIQNKTAEFVPIGFCQVVIGGTAYGFLEDDLLAPNEYRSYSFFYDDSSRPKSVSLRNSGDNEIVWRRSVGGQAEPLQRLQYSNAPEGSSWSRYDTGWRWDDTPTPNLDNSSLPEERDIVPIERAVPDPAPNGPTTDRVEADPGAQRADIPVTITEILPNPASPLADDTDEFVELYNSGSEAVALRGYRLQAGSNFTYNYTFEDEVISPHGYLTVTSGDTPISLSNKAGRVRLTTASGEVVAQTDPYESADAGAAWAWIQGKWQWTHKPTPSAANVLTAAPAKVKKSKKSGSRAKSKKAAKKKSSKTKAAKTAAASKGSGSDDGADADVVPPVHTSILVGVGALAVLYAAYEYRHDIANRIHQLRTNRGLRRASRRSA